MSSSFLFRQAIKPLSGSAPSVRAPPPSATGTGDTTDGKQPSKSRQKKFQRHFPQVGPEEKVLNCKFLKVNHHFMFIIISKAIWYYQSRIARTYYLLQLYKMQLFNKIKNLEWRTKHNLNVTKRKEGVVLDSVLLLRIFKNWNHHDSNTIIWSYWPDTSKAVGRIKFYFVSLVEVRIASIKFWLRKLALSLSDSVFMYTADLSRVPLYHNLPVIEMEFEIVLKLRIL